MYCGHARFGNSPRGKRERIKDTCGNTGRGKRYKVGAQCKQIVNKKK